MKRFLLLFGVLAFLSSYAQQRPALIPYRKGELWGYCDTTKKIIIPLQYDRAFPFVNGKALVITTKKDSLLQIDSTGRVVSVLPYHANDYVGNGLMRISSTDWSKMGVIDVGGNVVVRAKYSSVEILGTDSFEVVLPGKKGAINSKGEVIRAFVREENSDDEMPAPIIMPEGNCDTPCLWGRYSEQMAVAAHKGKFGYANAERKIAVPCKYSMADTFLHGLGRVTFDKPGQNPEPGYKDDKGVYHATAIIMEDGYVDRLGNEYWED